MPFIDARKLGFMVDRTRKEFSAADVSKIADTYRAWRLGEGYEGIAGFCKSDSIDEIISLGHVLTPVAMWAPRRWRKTTRPLRRCRTSWRGSSRWLMS